MANEPDSKLRDWWGTRNGMSEAEVHFRRALHARHDVLPIRQPRAMIITRMVEGRKSVTEQFQEPEKFLHRLGYVNDHYKSSGARHLIILEDLSLEWVEKLGPRLGIPVYVFALHWADPTDHVNGELRVPIGESPARHFILSYRQSLPFFIKNRQNNITVNGVDKGQLRRWTWFRVKGLVADSNPELEYRLDCNVVRPITSQSDKYEDNEPETSEQLVTYYAFESTTAAGSRTLRPVPVGSNACSLIS